MSFHAFTGMEEAAAERCPRGREFISTSSRANLDNPMAPDPLLLSTVDVSF